MPACLSVALPVCLSLSIFITPEPEKRHMERHTAAISAQGNPGKDDRVNTTKKEVRRERQREDTWQHFRLGKYKHKKKNAKNIWTLEYTCIKNITERHRRNVKANNIWHHFPVTQEQGEA